MAGKKALYLEIAELIERRIDSHQYTGVMPGVHRLGRELGVNPKTVQRAMDLLVAQGRLYRPNSRRTYVHQDAPLAAKVVAPRRPDCVRVFHGYGLERPAISPFMAGFFAGVRRACRRHHMDVEIDQSGPDSATSSHAKRCQRRLEAFPEGAWGIVLGSMADAQTLAVIRKRGLNVVFADSLSAIEGLTTVNFDWFTGMIELVETLRVFGHQRIAGLLHPKANAVLRATREGFEVGLEHMGLNADHCPLLVREEGTIVPPEEIVPLLTRDPRPTAVISKITDFGTILAAAKLAGLRVPGLLSVVMLGFASTVTAPPRIARLDGDGKFLGITAVESLFTYGQTAAFAHVHVPLKLKPAKSIRRPLQAD